MRMNKAATFDALATAYDNNFTESCTGQAQRAISRKWLQPLLSDQSGLHLLEINCGTGADALWLANMGHQVTATDVSPVMIYEAKRKATHQNNLSFETCAFDELQITFSNRQFDCIFSNFAGLNCVPPDDMPGLAKQLYSLLRPGGYLAVVLFGKYCVWESLYYLLKANPKQAFRRWTNKKVMVPLTESVTQPVYYYSIKNFVRLMAPFQLAQTKPVGLFIPPSYLEGMMQQRSRFFRSLVQLENSAGNASYLSTLADHSFILLKKEVL
jgi:ubiquinone/menaquinone biosynthesis C-methylase UbiE